MNLPNGMNHGCSKFMLLFQPKIRQSTHFTSTFSCQILRADSELHGQSKRGRLLGAMLFPMGHLPCENGILLLDQYELVSIRKD